MQVLVNLPSDSDATSNLNPVKFLQPWDLILFSCLFLRFSYRLD